MYFSKTIFILSGVIYFFLTVFISLAFPLIDILVGMVLKTEQHIEYEKLVFNAYICWLLFTFINLDKYKKKKKDIQSILLRFFCIWAPISFGFFLSHNTGTYLPFIIGGWVSSSFALYQNTVWLIQKKTEAT